MRIVARLLVLLPLLWVEGVWANVCFGPYFLETQAQIDAFGTSGCTAIDGLMTVSTFESGNDIVNLDGLANLTSVSGSLDILLEGNTVLTSLDGLSNLNSVGGVMQIFQTQLTNLDGLSKLSSVGGLLILMNESLTNADGLANLTTVNGELRIGPTALTDLDALANLETVAGDLSLSSNFALTNVDGLSNIKSVGGNLIINNNDALTNLDGLANLTSVGGYLSISNNAALTNLDGLAKLTSVGGYLDIWRNDALTNLDGLANLTSIGTDLDIRYNDALTTINGLAGLTSIGGELYIASNDALSRISGFPNLSYVGENLNIIGNTALERIDGLNALINIDGSLQIDGNNALLSVTGLNALIKIAVEANISNNSNLLSLEGLSSLAEVSGRLRLYGNHSLESLAAMESVIKLGSLELVNNSSLTECGQLALVLGWPNGPPDDGVDGSIFVGSNNGVGCSSVAQILSSVSGPTQPVITEATTSSNSISLALTPSTTTDTLFPVTGYSASCTGSEVDVSGSPATDLLDNTPIQEALTVTGYDPVSVSSPITVDVDITHSDPSDLVITLTSPQGTTLTLWDRGSAGGENLVGTFPTTLTPVDSLDAVASEAKDGDWILTAEDVDVGPLVREGVLNSWGLQFKETITVTGEESPLTIEGMQMGRDYSCTVSPITKLGVTPASEPLTVQISPALPFIERFYVNILGRPSDVGGLNAWLDVINTQSASTVVLGFLNSPEFLAKNLDDAAFVDILYRTLFDREGDTGGVDYWLSELASGRLRDMVIWGFLRAAEFKTLSDSFGVTALNAADESAYGIRAFVERFYTLVLGRQPDRGGFDNWVTALTNGSYAGGDIARAFFLSPEYLGQNTTNEAFVETAYRAFFGREADPAGKQGWLNALAQGQSREYVLDGFIGSAEFVALAKSYGINASRVASEPAPRARGVEVELRASEKAKPIPALPLSILLFLSGLIGLFGVRQLAHR